MNLTEKLFVDILGNYITGKEISVRDFDNVDKDRLRELVKIHRVAGIVYSVSRDYIEDKELRDYLEMGFLSDVALSARTDSVIAKLKSVFNEAEIGYVFVKGSQIRTMYPNQELRTMSDIDVLLKSEDMERAKSLLISEGMRFVPEYSTDNVWDFRYGKSEIEMHYNLVSDGRLMNGYDYKGYFNDAFSHRQLVDGYLFHLEDDYNLTYMIFHIAKHFYNSGCGVRMLLDLPVLVKNARNLSWDKVWKELEKIQLKDFAMRLFKLSEWWFGDYNVEYPEDFNFNDHEVVENFIICGGVYGFYERNTDADQIRMKINESGGNKGYVAGMLRWAFPSMKLMREYSEWFRNKPAILLPVAYVERFLRNAKERGGIVKWGKNVLTGRKDLVEKDRILNLMNIR